MKRLKEVMRKIDLKKRMNYSELSEVAGRPVRSGNKGYPSLRQAIRELRDEGIHFATISDDWHQGKFIEGGIERISDEEAIKLVPVDARILNSRAKLLLSKVKNVAFDFLPEDLKVLHNTMTTVATTVEFTTQKETMSQIEKRVRAGNCPLPTREVFLMVDQ